MEPSCAVWRFENLTSLQVTFELRTVVHMVMMMMLFIITFAWRIGWISSDVDTGSVIGTKAASYIKKRGYSPIRLVLGLYYRYHLLINCCLSLQG